MMVGLQNFIQETLPAGNLHIWVSSPASSSGQWVFWSMAHFAWSLLSGGAGNAHRKWLAARTKSQRHTLYCTCAWASSEHVMQVLLQIWSTIFQRYNLDPQSHLATVLYQATPSSSVSTWPKTHTLSHCDSIYLIFTMPTHQSTSLLSWSESETANRPSSCSHGVPATGSQRATILA